MLIDGLEESNTVRVRSSVFQAPDGFGASPCDVCESRCLMISSNLNAFEHLGQITICVAFLVIFFRYPILSLRVWKNVVLKLS